MLRQTLRTKPVLLVTATLFAIGACSTDLGGPEPVQKRQVVPPPRLDEVTPQSEMTIVDEDGSQYTLNIPDRKVYYSDGRILSLTEGQTDSVAQAFYSTLATDPVARDLYYIAAGNDPSCPDPRPNGMCNQQESRVVPPIEVRPHDGIREIPKRRQAPSKRRTSLLENRAVSSLGGVSFAQYGGSSPNPCSNIAYDVMNRLNERRSVRTKFLKEGIAIAVSEAWNALEKIIPPGTAAGAEFISLLVEHEAVMTNANFLGVIWNSYNCGNRTVEVGPIFGPGNYSSVGATVRCEWMHFDISFNGGPSGSVWAYYCRSMM